MHHPTQGSREATPSSGTETLPDIAAHGTQKGVTGGRKRRKQRLQGTMTTTDDNNGEAGGSSVKCASTATRSDKC
jgi:hypothetical protein